MIMAYSLLIRLGAIFAGSVTALTLLASVMA